MTLQEARKYRHLFRQALRESTDDLAREVLRGIVRDFDEIIRIFRKARTSTK